MSDLQEAKKSSVNPTDCLKNKTIVFGVTGGIAAYKAVDAVSKLKKLGASVFVVMTKNACAFVSPLTFETMSVNPVVVDTFERPQTWEVEHIALAKKADLFCIAPATANIIAKMAHGIADDMLSTTLLATTAPVLLAPAMNTNMWQAPATLQNVQTLKDQGVHFVGPGDGFLAEGTSGPGRMSEPQAIVNEVVALLLPNQDLLGKSVLVTAGPTQEALDPVRYLSNRSSGKMGYALAKEAARRGAKVTLVTGPVSIPLPVGMDKVISITTTQDLYNALVPISKEYDIIIQAAAPGDYRFAQVHPEKMKKDPSKQSLTLELVENPDVAAAIGAQKRPGQILVGFAAETSNLEENAKNKLLKKGLDLIVANDVTQPGAGFDGDTNVVTLVSKEQIIHLPMEKKKTVATFIVDFLIYDSCFSTSVFEKM